VLRTLQVPQRSWIGKKRRDSFRCRISIDDRINQRRAEVAPSLVTSRCSNESRDKLLLQRCSNSGKIDMRTDRGAVTGSQGVRQSPKRKVRRRCVGQQKDNTNERDPANKSHFTVKSSVLRMFENKSDARTRAHSQSCRETVDMSADTFRTKCFWSPMRPRIAFIRTEVLLKCRDLSKLSVAAPARFSSNIGGCVRFQETT